MTKLFLFDGSEQYRSFAIENDTIYIGRSPENDVQVMDITVSRKHLKIIKKETGYIAVDLSSKNGTFIDGNYIEPNVEVKLAESVPVVIGMSLICLGEKYSDSVASLMDSLSHPDKISEKILPLEHHRRMTDQKNIELIRKVNSIINESLNVNEISEKILDHILDHFKRVDRGVMIIFVDNEAGEISELAISRSRSPDDDSDNRFSRLVVDKAIKHEKAVLIPDVSNEKEAALSETLKLLRIGSVMCVPMISGSKIRGVIYVDSFDKPHGFREEDFSLLSDLSDFAALAIDDALFYKSLEKDT
jgi:hypothetical protein